MQWPVKSGWLYIYMLFLAALNLLLMNFYRPSPFSMQRTTYYLISNKGTLKFMMIKVIKNQFRNCCVDNGQWHLNLLGVGHLNTHKLRWPLIYECKWKNTKAINRLLITIEIKNKSSPLLIHFSLTRFGLTIQYQLLLKHDYSKVKFNQKYTRQARKAKLW